MAFRARVAALPWPAWAVFFLASYAVVSWPVLLLDREPAAVVGLPGVLTVILLARALDGRERRELSGWDRRQRVQVTERARLGTLPATVAERAALRRLVERDLRERRALHWVMPVAFAAMIAVLVLRVGGRAPLGTALGTAWYVVLAVLFTRLALRMRADWQAILTALAVAGTPPAPEPDRRSRPTHHLEDLLD